MKKSIIFSLALVIISVASVNAQGFQLGIKGGVNATQIDGRSFEQGYRYGYALGGFAEINFTKHFGIQPEVLWNEYQTRTATSIGGAYDGLSNNSDINLNYLTIPILLAFKPAKFLTIHLGPQFGYLINESQTLITNGKDAFKKGDFSMVGGAQLNLAWFKFGARYFIGLNNLDDVGQMDNWKNKGVQVYVGIRII